MNRVIATFCSTVLFALAFAGLAAADLTAVSAVPAPEGQGDIFSPGVRLVADLPQSYLEEEFFVSGTANVFTYDDPPVLGEKRVRDEEVPYTTRIIVRRPERAHAFRGTLVVEWWNSTAGFDSAPVWDPGAEFFAREGWIYVGVTNSSTAIDFLVNGCVVIVPPPRCGARYTGLSMPMNGQANEMVSEIVTLLRSEQADNPLPSDFRSRLRRVFHAGQSQQGGSVVTYANEFHLDLNDGYFIMAAGASGRPLSFPSCGSTGAPPFPDCTPTLPDSRVRTDLDVPVYRAQTETDMRGVIARDSRQQDVGKFRYYETAGTAHSTVHEDIEVIPAGIFGPTPVLLEDLCANPMNTLADGPVFGRYLYNAMWKNMEREARRGVPSPHGDLIEVANGQIARDAFGNAQGGIRLPAMNLPTATHAPPNNFGKPACDFTTTFPPDCDPTGGLGGLACFLSGSTFPFDAATLESEYPSRFGYILGVFFDSLRLRKERFLLREDAREIVRRAIDSEVGGPQP